MDGFSGSAIEKFRLSGQILRETREYIRTYVREGMLILTVCEKVEEIIRKKGGIPAFPCNVSINEIAAHYTSPPNDDKIIPDQSLVKVDLGVHVDGYVTDTAVTICFKEEYVSLVETAEQALDTAVKQIHSGIASSKIGKTIQTTVNSRGYKPISNLTGHQIGRFIIHAGTSIPNISTISFSKLKLNNVYAIEPFVTLSEAVGKVENSLEKTIFRYLKNKKLKDPYSTRLLRHIRHSFGTLPFTERWLKNLLLDEKYKAAFQELLSVKAIMGYPVFIEVSRKPVAQAEHTVLVTDNGCEILT